MESGLKDSIVKNALMDSIDREELLLRKYEEYNISQFDDDFMELLTEFKETSREHIDLLKGKLQQLHL